LIEVLPSDLSQFHVDTFVDDFVVIQTAIARVVSTAEQRHRPAEHLERSALFIAREVTSTMFDEVRV
jgi:hypothetical protein